MDPIPFFGNDREAMIYAKAFQKLSQEVWSTGQYLNGPWVENFEKSLAEICHRKYAVSVGSCTDALTFGLKELGLVPGSEILVPDFSFIASASPIMLANHKPVFIDVDINTAMVSPTVLEKTLHENSNIKAFLAVSLYGAVAPFDDYLEVCSRYGVTLIEDAAQSFGAHLGTRPAGSFGLFSALSFDPTKTLHGLGAGGCLLTDDESLYKAVKQHRLHGRDENNEFSKLGRKSLLSSIDANIMNFKLKELPKWIEDRRLIASRYEKIINESPYFENIKIPKNSSHTFHKFVLRCKSNEIRTKLQKSFSKSSITTRIHYDKPLCQNPLFADFQTTNKNATSLSKTVLSLPVFHELKDEEVQRISLELKSFAP